MASSAPPPPEPRVPLSSSEPAPPPPPAPVRDLADHVTDHGADHGRPAAPTTPPAPSEREPRKHSLLRELPVLVVIAFAIALLIKTFLVQAFFIPSASMEPTLLIGDRVLVEKLSYRFGEPERGDIVVFEKDLAQVVGVEPSRDRSLWEEVSDSVKGLFGFPTGSSQDFIKRVIAVEGDEVAGRDGKVYVNGDAIDEPYLQEGLTTGDFPPETVPAGMLFVMGDNRGNSDDSRNFGPVPEDTVVGRAFVLIWPPSDFGTL